LINNNEFVEELHTSNSKNHSFYVRSRFSDKEQIKIICEYKSPLEEKPDPLSSFFKSMSRFEREEEDNFGPEEEFNPFRDNKFSQAVRQRDQIYKQMGRFVLLVPTSITLKRLQSVINIYLKKKQPKKPLSKSKNPFSKEEVLDNVRAFREDLERQLRNPLNDDLEDEYDQERPLVGSNNIRVKIINHDQDNSFDIDEKIEDWVRRKVKMSKSNKSYLRIFQRQKLVPPNFITFTIEDPQIEEEEKQSQDEMDIEDEKFSKDKRRSVKANRTYSLYLQKSMKSLQDKEAERLIAKDIQ
jgi:hypothetical protein